MRYRLIFLIPVLYALFWGAMTVFALPPDDLAQTEEQNRERKSAQAFRWTQRPPVIDGVLSEELWMRLPPATNFTQQEPREGQAATLRTEVRFSYDAQALYIGAIMYVDDPEEIQSTLSRRDNAGNSERLLISLDTYRDNRTAYTFGITADGVRIDYYHPNDAEHSRDYSFDPVWEAQVTQSQEAWIAEIRIPFSQLRFNDSESQLWGLNLNRYIPSRNEDTYWVMIPKNDAGWSSRFGRLTGIEGIRPSSRIELTPYTVGDLTISRGGNPADPFYDRMAWRGNAGLDLKMGLGPNLTLDATVNPDFGQVEADPAEVNLSAYETYYSERRPFFVEGIPLLRGEGPEYFYSRRIGAKPRMLPGGVFIDHFSNTTILGASKLSGRLASGLSIAALSAVTEREFVNTYDPRTGTYGLSMIEPLTGYGVLRMQQELDEESGSVVGVVLTGVSRDLTTPDSETLLPRQATSGGVDWKLRFDRASYELQGHAGFSHLIGSKEAVDLVQRSSTHFFQRPDADHITYDPQRTALTGVTAG
ncbi:MAG: carbohydrate binding family 9 domain-containing protein, partial [Bacteroidetes bacterium]|nr:carbohydrate binding family 9 domain-containing protein [Bacteroidota bacterium]